MIFRVCSFICFWASIASGIDYYVADFSIDGQGSTHDTVGDGFEMSPVIGANWRIRWDSNPSSDQSTNRLVTEGGRFVSSDWGGRAFFETDSIDVSAARSVSIAAVGETVGDEVFNSSLESFAWFYSFDGGPPVYQPARTTDGSLDFGVILDVAEVSSLVVGFDFRINGDGDGFEIRSVRVSDEEFQSLALIIPDQVMKETGDDGGLTLLEAEVRRTGDLENSLDLVLVNGDSTEISIPEGLTIPAGEASARFQVSAVDDDVLDGDQVVSITVSAVGFTSDLGLVTVVDDEVLVIRDVVINEVRVDDLDADDEEYVELYSASGAGVRLDDLWLVVIGDSAENSGVVERAYDLSGEVLRSNFFLIGSSTMTLAVPDMERPQNFLENGDNISILLVEGFSGVEGDDLDVGDDGVLETRPWVRLLSGVSLVKEVNGDDGAGGMIRPGGTEWDYSVDLGIPAVGPDGSFVPGHIYRSSDGSGEWEIGPFAALPGDPSANPPIPPVELADTPGVENQVGPPLPVLTDPVIEVIEMNGRELFLTARGLSDADWIIERSLDLGQSDSWDRVESVRTDHEDGTSTFRVLAGEQVESKMFYRLRGGFGL